MDPIAIYDELLAVRRDEAAASIPRLAEELRRRGAQYGGRDLVRVLRPKFVTSGEYATLVYACGVILQAARRLAERVLHSKELRAFVGLSDGETRLIGPKGRVADPCVLARLDSFQTPNGPRFVELNAEAPAGGAFSDAIAGAFAELPIVAEFAKRTGAFMVPNRDRLLETLLVCWSAAGGRGRPSILVTDYLDARTVNEFHLVAEHFRRAGFACVVEDPRRLEYRGGRLYAQGRTVDLVYRRVLANEFLEREAELASLWSAFRDGAVVMVNPFRCKLVHKKVTFALLTGDGGDDGWLTAEERRVIREHVPWTRKVRETRTTYAGRTVDLLPFVAENRDRFVLKPSDEYGGKGVVLGWQTGADEFESALAAACRAHWVVQERVEPVEEPFPVFEPPLASATMTVDLDPYLYFGHVHGVLARLAAGSISNVTSGGGQVPVMVVPEWPRGDNPVMRSP
jgi:hypothetical protein